MRPLPIANGDSPTPPAPARVGVISLGCPKNLVDTEVLLGRVAERHVVCADPEDADVVIVNTCGFIDQAREESLEAIAEVTRWKEEGRIRGVVVAGCLAQRWGERLRTEHPGVDSVIGMAEYERIGEVLAALSARDLAQQVQAPWRTLVARDPTFPVGDQGGRLRVTPPHYAYLMVSDGCDNACTFCSIPSFRGLFRSKPREVVLREARELVASGAVELNLISQDLTDWGKDIPGSGGLAGLLEDLAGIEGLRWIRLLYAYPGHVSDRLIAALRDLPQVVPYLDIPIQHISTPVLKRMGRRHTREETVALLERLRAEVPDLVLRTTFICGFPGSTRQHFDELLDFVRAFRFERLGAFPYSVEPGTPAGERFSDDVPPEEKAARVDELMRVQQEIAFDHAEAQVGKTVDVLVEGTDEAGRLVGRSVHDAPEIDCSVVLARWDEEPDVGTIVPVKVIGSVGYDLIGACGE
ncbi:MAG: 30S ribosomal protein S12 methylthiotransferase RimO [Planctomycetota bacterium]|nr:MAG: 30S ribosomal protein S12 methylthiotransferase RimO [Planctomycetota bacterium]